MKATKEILSINEDPQNGPSNRSKASIKDIEEILYRRARVAPREPIAATETEQAIAQHSFENKTQRQVTVSTGIIAKTGSQASLATYRAVKALANKLDLHSRTLVNMQDDIANIRRVLRRFDTPLSTQALSTNPALNPALNQYVPFDDQVLTKEFFQSPERITALATYVLTNVKWSVAHFINEAINLTCTFNYREKHSFPATGL